MGATGCISWGRARSLARGALRSVLCVGAIGLGGCGEAGRHYGLQLRVVGDHNDWNKTDEAPTLNWDWVRGRYQGVVALPGDAIGIQLFAPRTGTLFGAPGGVGSGGIGDSTAHTVPGDAALQSADSVGVAPLPLATPLPARYALEFDPESGQLRVDLADDAERDQPAGAALLIRALRGADRLSATEQRGRAEALRGALQQQAIETPLAVGTAPSAPFPGVTFVDFGSAASKTVSLVGDWNAWSAGVDVMHATLGGQLRVCGHRVSGRRLEYQIDRDGVRTPDPQNLELAWGGETLPANPDNILGGNVGTFHSVALTPGYVEAGPRLRRLPLPPGPLGIGEAYVQLPPGYAQSEARYPSVYIHDGKDALVRGRYDRVLYALAEREQVPATVAVFLPAPSSVSDRLSLYSHFPDAAYPEIVPHGQDYAHYILTTVLATVERSYRAGAPRAMLGIDMAGPFTYQLAWDDPEGRFRRLVSQSGRFGWGQDPQTLARPYLASLARDRGSVVERISMDWTDGDLFQVQVHEALRVLLNVPAYAGKLQMTRQVDASTQVWESLRSRAVLGLAFALSDLVTPTGKL